MFTGQYNTIYKGIVIQNDDPLQSGRVKVFVPFIHTGLLPLPEQKYDENVNFGLFGKNVNKQNKNQIDLTEYIEILKSKLPWCQVIMPITGQTGNSKYNNATGLTSPSDSDSSNYTLALSDTELGGGPAEINEGLTSIWGSGAAAGGIMASSNPGGFNTDAGYNKAAGNFTVPTVNTQVWVTFMNGDAQFPVVIGHAPATLDFQQNLTPSGYPGSYENRGDVKSKSNSDEIIFRHQQVSNSGACKTIVNNNTNNRFESKVHVSGSSETTTNDGSKNSFITGDKSNITQGNVFEDHKTSFNSHVDGPRTVIARGGSRRVVGSNNVAAAQGEKMELSKISKMKALFENKRAEPDTLFSSTEQSYVDAPTECPACSKNKTQPTYKGESGLEQIKKLIPVDLNVLKSLIPFEIPAFNLKNLSVENVQYPQVNECVVCKAPNKGKSPSSQDGNFPKDDRKEKIGPMYVEAAPKLASYGQALGEDGDDITEVTGNMVINVGLAFNDLDPIRVDKKGKLTNAGVSIDKVGAYQKQVESPLIEPVHVDDLSGGTLTIAANNKLVFIVGAGGIKFQTAGMTEIGGALANFSGEQVNISSSNEVNVNGGGRLNLEGKILSLKSGSGQVGIDDNLAIGKNFVCQGGGMFNGPLHVNVISAPISYQETEELQESYGTTDYKVAKIIGYLLKNITWKAKIGSQGQPIVQPSTGIPIDGATFTITPDEDVNIKSIGTTGALPEKSNVRIHPHSHIFRNVPLNLTGNAEDNFNLAKSTLLGDSPAPPMEIKNGKMGPDPDKNVNKKSNFDKNFDRQETGQNMYVDFT